MRVVLALLSFAACLSLTAAFLPPTTAAAEGGLPVPTGKIILTVTGAIVRTNGANGVAVFDRDMLERLGLKTLRTSTPWTEGVREFEGVPARALLVRVGARGTSAVATALNDYAVTIPIDDFTKFDVLLALRMDGRDLLPRDKGPVWIVYPRDDFAQLRDTRYDQRWAWQLTRLDVR
jgi:hypothetical protein